MCRDPGRKHPDEKLAEVSKHLPGSIYNPSIYNPSMHDPKSVHGRRSDVFDISKHSVARTGSARNLQNQIDGPVHMLRPNRSNASFPGTGGNSPPPSRPSPQRVSPPLVVPQSPPQLGLSGTFHFVTCMHDVFFHDL